MDHFGSDSLNSLFFQVIKLHRIRASALFGEIGLSRGQPPILELLWKKDGCNQREIAEILHIKPATVTDILQRMEKAGLLERRADPSDSRMSRVYLTQKGKRSIIEVEKALNTLENECFRGFTLEEKILLRRFFIQMRDNLLKVCNLNPIAY